MNNCNYLQDACVRSDGKDRVACDRYDRLCKYNNYWKGSGRYGSYRRRGPVSANCVSRVFRNERRRRGNWVKMGRANRLLRSCRTNRHNGAYRYEYFDFGGDNKSLILLFLVLLIAFLFFQYNKKNRLVTLDI